MSRCVQTFDWYCMFRVTSEDNIDEYTNSVIGFIQKCIDDVIPMSFKTDFNQ
jgi:hypothetical protein